MVDAAHEEMVKLRSTLPDDSSGSSVAAEQQQQHHEDEDEEWSVVTKKNKAAVTRGREDLGGEQHMTKLFVPVACGVLACSLLSCCRLACRPCSMAASSAASKRQSKGCGLTVNTHVLAECTTLTLLFLSRLITLPPQAAAFSLRSSAAVCSSITLCVKGVNCHQCNMSCLVI